MQSLHVREFHHLGSGESGRKGAVRHMVPPAWSQRSRVAEPALDFVGKSDSLNDPFTGRTRSFSDGQNGCNVIRRMRRFLREVGIVEIEIADEGTIGKRGEVGERPVAGSP